MGKMSRTGLFACFNLLLWLPLASHVRANIVEPPFVDFGIKCMCSLSNMHANDEASFGKSSAGGGEGGADITSLLGTWGRPGLYAELVFTDFFGLQTGAYYLSQYCNLSPKYQKDLDQSAKKGIRPVKFRSHSLSIPLALCFYPTGREVDESFITLLVGLDFLLTFKNEFDERTQLLSSDGGGRNAERLRLFNCAALFGLNFQFPVGLFVEFMVDFWMMSALSHTNTLSPDRVKAGGDGGKRYEYAMFSDLKELYALNAKDVSIGIGYNFGALLYR